MSSLKKKSSVKGLNSREEYKESWEYYRLCNTYDIALKREPENEYDDNAVGYTIDGNICGYISRELAVRIAPLIDAGWLFAVERIDIQNIDDNPDDYDPCEALEDKYHMLADMMLYGISPDATADERTDYERIERQRAEDITRRKIEKEEWLNKESTRKIGNIEEQIPVAYHRNIVKTVSWSVLAVFFFIVAILSLTIMPVLALMFIIVMFWPIYKAVTS